MFCMQDATRIGSSMIGKKRMLGTDWSTKAKQPCLQPQLPSSCVCCKAPRKPTELALSKCGAEFKCHDCGGTRTELKGLQSTGGKSWCVKRQRMVTVCGACWKLIQDTPDKFAHAWVLELKIVKHMKSAGQTNEEIFKMNLTALDA